MIVVFFSIYGPYIHARVGALSECSAMPVVGLEGGSSSGVYAWEPVSDTPGFEKQTLFPGASLEAQPSRQVFSRMMKTLGALSPAVVAIPGWSSAGSLAALLWCRRNGVPAVLMADSTADDEPRVGWKEAVKRRVVSQCSAALVGGAPHVEYAAALGMPRERIFTGYDVVDNEHFAVGAAWARAGADALRAARVDQIRRAAAALGDDHRQACGHRFVHHQPPLLRGARVHEGPGEAIVGRQLVILLEARHMHAVLQPRLADLALERRAQRPVPQQPREHHGAMGAGGERSDGRGPAGDRLRALRLRAGSGR